jgi:hypothetical protein
MAGQTFTLTQAAAPCTYDVSHTTLSFEAIGGAGAVDVRASDSCAWTAVSNAGWIVVTAGASGNGNGAVSFTVAPNVGAARTGVIMIAGQAVTISQAALLCSYTIAPTSQAFTATGGTGSVALTTGGVCVWTASSSAAWITITGGGAGAGSGIVQFSVAANPGPARNAALTIGPQTFAITQEAPACSYNVAPANQPVPAGGGNATVAVTTASGCAWSASSSTDWITIIDSGSGDGNGVVSFATSPNIGPARSGTLTVAGSTVTVSQAAP